jgi:hypothetical protein
MLWYEAHNTGLNTMATAGSLIHGPRTWWEASGESWRRRALFLNSKLILLMMSATHYVSPESSIRLRVPRTRELPVKSHAEAEIQGGYR